MGSDNAVTIIVQWYLLIGMVIGGILAAAAASENDEPKPTWVFVALGFCVALFYGPVLLILLIAGMIEAVIE